MRDLGGAKEGGGKRGGVMWVPPLPSQPRWGEQRGPSCVLVGTASCWGCFHDEGVEEAKRGSNTTHPSSSPPHPPPKGPKVKNLALLLGARTELTVNPPRAPPAQHHSGGCSSGGLHRAEPSPKPPSRCHTKGQQGQTLLLGHQIHPVRNLSPAPATGTVPPGGVRSLHRRARAGSGLAPAAQHGK